MKKRILPMILTLVLIAVIAALIGCGNNTDTTLQNGNDNTDDPTSQNGNDNTDNPTSQNGNIIYTGDTVSYTVEITEGTSGSTSTPLTDIIENIRQQVVDVYATASTGLYAGSGVIIGESGNDKTYIVTNHHVIDGCYAFEVDVLNIAADGKESLITYPADLIGGSPKDDIAVLRIDASGLSAATWITDSNKVKVGTEVIAIGNPLGVLGGTVTKGIISATARAIEVDGIGVMTLMQTDAAINSGNSGGGLFSTDGKLIGIVNSGYTDYEGLNFAIPANDAKYVFTELVGSYREDLSGNVVNYGCVSNRANIGLTFDEYDMVYSTNSTSSESTYMLFVTGVESGSDAAGKSVVVGDAIASIEYDSVTYACSTTKYNDIYNYYLEMCTLVNNIEVGDTLTLNCYKTASGGNRWSGYYNYISGSQSYNITATQYTYTPPSAI